MTKFMRGLFIATGVLVVLILTAGIVFYVKIYKPIGSPLMAMSASQVLEQGRLKNQARFDPPASGILTADQVARFVAVEDAVAARVGNGATTLAAQRHELEQANAAHTLSLPAAFSAFGPIKAALLEAKTAQIEAMNQANFSKAEFEWVRRQLYRAAGIDLNQVDVSAVVAGEPDAAVRIRLVTVDVSGGDDNARLARPLASKLDAWSALAFFGL